MVLGSQYASRQSKYRILWYAFEKITPVINRMNRLMSILVALRRLPPLSQLTGDEERMLFELQHLLEARGEITITDVYEVKSEKSASSLYRLLMSLHKKGFVEFSSDGADKRKKIIAFSDVAKQLFKSLE